MLILSFICFLSESVLNAFFLGGGEDLCLAQLTFGSFLPDNRFRFRFSVLVYCKCWREGLQIASLMFKRHV